MTDILLASGTPIILGNSGDYSPTAGASLTGTRTHQLNLTGLVAGAYRQSAKFDMGATRAQRYFCRAAIEPASAPAAGGAVEVFLGLSDNATAANNNPGNLSGADAAYTGYGAAATDATECIGQLTRIGQVIASADADIMVSTLGVFIPYLRYGMIVVRNGFSVNLGADAVEMSVQLFPITDSF